MSNSFYIDVKGNHHFFNNRDKQRNSFISLSAENSELKKKCRK